MKKLIIFDCDGVLVDSEIVANRVYAGIITQFGYPLTAEDSIRRFTGIDCKSANDIIAKEAGISLPDNLSELMDQAILQALEEELAPLMLPVLTHDLFKNANKCVASNSPRNQVLRSLIVTKQDTHFKNEHVFSAKQVQKPKPAPDLFLFAAKQLGYHPSDCLVIEDSLTGIQAARAAGMSVIGFLGGEHAGFDWYQERIRKQGIPVAGDHQELIAIIQTFLNKENCLTAHEEALIAP